MSKFSTENVRHSQAYERQDLLNQLFSHNKQTQHLRRRSRQRVSTIDESYTQYSLVKLNKKKKYQMQEEKNTEIDRSNRILYEKIAKAGRKSQPSTVHTIAPSKTHKNKKIKTSPAEGLPNSRSLVKQSRNIQHSRHKKQAITLFMGQDFIDSVQFKIKLIIADGLYYLIAQNEHSKIILEMPEEEYWDLHYGELRQNPCHIFPYLQIHKGQISFRVKRKPSKKSGNLPKGIKTKDKGVSLPRI